MLHTMFGCFFLFKQKTAYELRISDWSSDLCSSDLVEFWAIIENLMSTEPGYPALSTASMFRVRDAFFNSPNAPVSYPFLWDATRSDFVQWNGVASNALLGPLGRNTGEVIGVFAILDWHEDRGDRKSTRLNSSH